MKSGLRCYNGFTPQQRTKKLRALHKLWPDRSHPCYRGPCDMCGDPDAPVAPHDEDYSEPYSWVQPAIYALCAPCHARLHRRFKYPLMWEAYVRHVARGGYGSDLHDRLIAREVERSAVRLHTGESVTLRTLRAPRVGDRWWERLNEKSPPAVRLEKSRLQGNDEKLIDE